MSGMYCRIADNLSNQRVADMVEEGKAKWLQDLCESPFTWNLPAIKPDEMDQYLISQMEMCENIEEENKFKWSSFTTNLQLSYELWHQLGDIVNATNYVDSCCEELERLTQAGCAEQLFSTIQGALWHVALSTKAHLQLASRRNALAAQDVHKAIECLERSQELGNFKAFLYLITLQWRHRSDKDPISEINSALERFTSDNCAAELLVYLGAAQLLLKGWWVKAVQCFVSSFKSDPTASYMKRFRGFFWKEKTNLLEIVMNELRLKYYSTDRNIFDVFLRKMSAAHPELMEKPLCPGLFASFEKKQMEYKSKFSTIVEEETDYNGY